MKAYVFINVRAGKARDVVDKLRRIDAVKSANACWGPPDVFAFVDFPALAEVVLDRIQPIDGIESTDTHIVID